MPKPNNKYALVLAGGGSKGAYQMGAWKALREINIELEAVAGVSIGSINGALIAQGDYEKALEFWGSISLDRGVNISTELPDGENLFARKNWPALLKEIAKNGGFDASPAREFFAEYIDEQRVRQSGIDMGLVTINMTRGKPVEIFKDDIPQGQLVEYLLASADIPLAINVGPNGERFLDGGAYDNTPVAMMRRHGYNRLIVVDIASIRGVAHKENNNNSEIVYIRPEQFDDLGASFDFSPEMNRKRMLMGYLDALKAFSCLLGKYYNFKPADFRSMVKRYGAEEVEQLEGLALKLGLDCYKIYTPDEFISAAKELFEKSKAETKPQDEPQAEEQPEEKPETHERMDSLLAELEENISDLINGDKEKFNLKARISSLLKSFAAEPQNDDVPPYASAPSPTDGNDPDDKKPGTLSTVLEMIKKARRKEDDFALAIAILEGNV